MPQQKTTIQIELTAAQKQQIWQATGREVNALELRLQGGPEPAVGQEGSAALEIPAGPDKEPAPEPTVIRRER